MVFHRFLPQAGNTRPVVLRNDGMGGVLFSEIEKVNFARKIEV